MEEDCVMIGSKEAWCEECGRPHLYVSVNTKEYNSEYCRSCNTIHYFRWKSFWKRLKNLF